MRSTVKRALIGGALIGLSWTTVPTAHADESDFMYGDCGFDSLELTITTGTHSGWISDRSVTTTGYANPRLIGGYAPTFAGSEVELPVPNAEPLANELNAFLGIVRSGGRPVVDGEDGRWAVTLAHALLTAARERRAVELVSA